MKKKNKVLIIKLGYTEILDKEEDGRIVSLGDILRTTPLLHKFKEDYVTWVTSEEAFPLLTGNPYISRLIKLDYINGWQLENQKFDTVINLEKIPGICALAEKIKAWKRYGFRFDDENGRAEAYDKASEVLAVSFNPEYKKENNKSFQELLFEMIGEKFHGEECILGYKPKSEEKYDIGFNVKVGNKWPSKAWPEKNWDELELKLQEDYSITRQDKVNDGVLHDLYSYIDWINSCRTIVTNDSLGLHLAITLGKKSIGLFGPTAGRELYLYDRVKIIEPYEKCSEWPCFEPKCIKYPSSCMVNISPERVERTVRDYIFKNNSE